MSNLTLLTYLILFFEKSKSAYNIWTIKKWINILLNISWLNENTTKELKKCEELRRKQAKYKKNPGKTYREIASKKMKRTEQMENKDITLQKELVW